MENSILNTPGISPDRALFISAEELMMNIKNKWLDEFLGTGWKIEQELSSYGQDQIVRIVSSDRSKHYEGRAERDSSEIFGNQYHDALRFAIDKAFSEFTKTLPRMDRIMRYGK